MLKFEKLYLQELLWKAQQSGEDQRCKIGSFSRFKELETQVGKIFPNFFCCIGVFEAHFLHAIGLRVKQS